MDKDIGCRTFGLADCVVCVWLGGWLLIAMVLEWDDWLTGWLVGWNLHVHLVHVHTQPAQIT